MKDYNFTPSEGVTTEMMLIAVDISRRQKKEIAAVICSTAEADRTDDVNFGIKNLEGRVVIVFKHSLVVWFYKENGTMYRGSNAEANALE